MGIIQLYAISLGVALLLGSLYVYFRDVGHIWEVVLQAMFYATPIIYPISMVADKGYGWAAKFADDGTHYADNYVAIILPTPYEKRLVNAGCRTRENTRCCLLCFMSLYPILVLHFTGFLARHNLEWLVLLLAAAVFPAVIYS